MISLFFFTILYHSLGAERTEVRKPVDASESYDEIVIDIGRVHQYVSNSTHDKASGTDEQTFIIGHSAMEQPSMMWLEGGYENNHYLYRGMFWVGYDNLMVKFDTRTSDDFVVFQTDESMEVSYSMTDVFVEPPYRIGVKCICRVQAWAENFRDDYIVYEYSVINQSGEFLADVYVGLHLDCGVSAAGGGEGNLRFWRDDMADYYLGRDKNGNPESISYMYDGDNINTIEDDTGGNLIPKECTGYIGSRILESPETKLGVPADQQSGHNWFDWGYCHKDDYYYSLMSDRRFDKITPSPNAYSFSQSVGPYDLAPMDTLRITFALGIGEGLERMRKNLQWAYDLYKYEQEVEKNIRFISRYPNHIEVRMKSDESIEFSIESKSAGNIELEYYWEVNEYLYNFQRETSFIFDAQEFPLGENTVVVTVSDGRYRRKHGWKVHIDPAPPVPKYELYPNYPNPFNTTTTIPFELKEDSQVRITIYDSHGRLVQTLLDEDLEAGKDAVVWDGMDERGGVLPSGCYLCQIQAGEFRSVRKMVLMK